MTVHMSLSPQSALNFSLSLSLPITAILRIHLVHKIAGLGENFEQRKQFLQCKMRVLVSEREGPLRRLFIVFVGVA